MISHQERLVLDVAMQSRDVHGEVNQSVVVCKLEKLALGKLRCICQACLYLGRIMAAELFRDLNRERIFQNIQQPNSRVSGRNDFATLTNISGDYPDFDPRTPRSFCAA